MNLPRINPDRHLKTIYKVILVFLAIIISATIFIHLPKSFIAGPDLLRYFRPAARAWLSGLSPYTVSGYYNPPWTTPLLVPFSIGPPRLGYVLLILFSFTVLAGTVRAFGGKTWTLLIVLTAPPMIGLFVLGQ